MFFDTHAHYDDPQFEDDRDIVLRTLHEEKLVDIIIIPGCDLISSEFSLKISERYDFVYAAVGFHPEDIAKYNPNAFEELKVLAAHEKCVAIGEIGLDYYWDNTHKDEQKELFIKQIELALEMKLPVIIHDREAHGDSLDIIRKYPELKGVFHCFSGSAEMATELLKRGWYLGFDGPITYKNARKALEVLAMCPLDRMLIETDSPYLPPVPMRGKRNDSSNLQYIAQKIAEIKGVSVEDVAKITSDNAREIFNI